MKTRGITSVIGSLASAALGMAVLAAVSANGNGALIRRTHSDTPWRGAAKAAAPAQPAATATTKAEVQVAVMAQPAPAKPTVTRSVPRK